MSAAPLIPDEPELIFDFKLTTYAKLNELNRLGIQFITLPVARKGLVREIDQTSNSAWRRTELKGSRENTHIHGSSITGSPWLVTTVMCVR